MPTIERTVATSAAPARVWEGLLGPADPLLSPPLLSYPYTRLGDGAAKGLEDALARL